MPINWLLHSRPELVSFCSAFGAIIGKLQGVVGANIGANTGGENIARDIAKCAGGRAPLTQYLAVIVLCSDILDLINWQNPEGIRRILERIKEACANSKRVLAFFVKLCSDIVTEKLETIPAAFRDRS